MGQHPDIKTNVNLCVLNAMAKNDIKTLQIGLSRRGCVSTVSTKLTQTQWSLGETTQSFYQSISSVSTIFIRLVCIFSSSLHRTLSSSPVSA